MEPTAPRISPVPSHADLLRLQARGWTGRVVVAEDDTLLRGVVAELLRDEGYTVTECADGGALVSEIFRERDPREPLPDVIVCDIAMPGQSGLDVVVRLREAHIDVPVVMITAIGDVAVRERAASLGVQCVLAKPFGSDDVLGAVARALATTH